jgi:hypothetical protein
MTDSVTTVPDGFFSQPDVTATPKKRIYEHTISPFTPSSSSSVQASSRHFLPLVLTVCQPVLTGSPAKKPRYSDGLLAGRSQVRTLSLVTFSLTSRHTEPRIVDRPQISCARESIISFLSKCTSHVLHNLFDDRILQNTPRLSPSQAPVQVQV